MYAYEAARGSWVVSVVYYTICWPLAIVGAIFRAFSSVVRAVRGGVWFCITNFLWAPVLHEVSRVEVEGRKLFLLRGERILCCIESSDGSRISLSPESPILTLSLREGLPKFFRITPQAAEKLSEHLVPDRQHNIFSFGG